MEDQNPHCPVVFQSYSTSDAIENIWLIIYFYKFVQIR